MKIKIKKLDYASVKMLPSPKKISPKRPMYILKALVKILSKKDFSETSFTPHFVGMNAIPDEPCLVLGNHSSFIDLEIAISTFFPKSLSIVCTSDAFVGKPWLMQHLGCISINKFVSDPSFLRDMSTALKKNKTHLLMYPEASYSFDGCATPLPKRLGSVLKLLRVHVMMITTHGAFLREPLYNCLQKRNVKVDADFEMLFSKEEIASLSVEEIDKRLEKAFSFDNFRYQQENNIKVDEPFRADGLQRILYKCPHCKKEGYLIGKGTRIKCNSCEAEYELDEYGKLSPINTEPLFSHIPDWYNWERAEVKREIENGEYLLDCDCKILVLHDYKAIYDIGKGHLRHDENGFHLTSDDKALDFHRSATDHYGLYADYYWYEVGDTICIGNKNELYYCFPDSDIPVAKARLATEEMFKLSKPARK